MKSPRLLTYFTPRAPLVLTYMLQQVDYDAIKFGTWVNGLPDLSKVMKRGSITLTSRFLLSVVLAYIAWLFPVICSLVLFRGTGELIWLAIIFLAPASAVTTLFFSSFLLQHLAVNPVQYKVVRLASKKLENLAAIRIAVLGSYGKTTMKELLSTVLSGAKVVAATPGNKNVLISHARWVLGLTGNEEVLIFEYGESRPGDIARLAKFSRPDMAVITGLAPAHMEDYHSLDAIAEDFAEVGGFAKPTNIYLNGESSDLLGRLQHGSVYSLNGVDGWTITDVQSSIRGSQFTMQKGKRKLRLHTGLIGLHQIGPLAAVVSIASSLGMSDEQITSGVAQTGPFEHRMKPYQLKGAWVIDDTYNGNIEGARAGLKLLSELEVSGKKIYVTPGFVEQGELTEKIHIELGRTIAAAKPDRVVLMKNSVLHFTQTGLEQGNFTGELLIEGNPLEFYTNLDHFVAAGDLILMQNDWPDSYN